MASKEKQSTVSATTKDLNALLLAASALGIDITVENQNFSIDRNYPVDQGNPNHQGRSHAIRNCTFIGDSSGYFVEEL